MSKSGPSPDLENFDRLNATTWLYTPSPHQRANLKEGTQQQRAILVPSDQQDGKTTSHPDLILLAAWMGGKPRPISKYTSNYQKIYPNAGILLITTEGADVLFRSAAQLTKSRADALTVLLALPKTARILVHAFSNGGALTVQGLTQDYKARTGVALPMDALVLDSTPGTNDFKRAIAAFQVGIAKNVVAQIVGGLLIRLVLIFSYVLHLVAPKTDSIGELRKGLNDQEFFGIAARRLYIFSESDTMISAKAVRDHAHDAVEKGYKVGLEEFVRTRHVGHMMGDANKYWSAVESLWSSALA